MKTQQAILKKANDLDGPAVQEMVNSQPQIVFAFGDTAFFQDDAFTKQLKAKFPGASILGCSTAGEIGNDGVFSGSMVLTSVHFKNPQLKFSSTSGTGLDDSFAMGSRLAEKLEGKDLNAVFILTQGVDINGSEVIKGIQSKLGADVLITGGLAGDGGAFKSTAVILNDSMFTKGAVAVGFYGNSVLVSFGSVGGWEAFGPTRKVTKAQGNILFELDNIPALSVYKNYLGEFAKDLPGSALHFPLSVLEQGKEKSDLIRTILGIDEANGSLILAGDIHQDGQVRLMHAQTPALVEGARHAGELAAKKMVASDADSSLAILVSCVGRKLAIGEDEIEDEVDAARESLHGASVTGFYSYGEVCPIAGVVTDCRLHNQTMTITLFRD